VTQTVFLSAAFKGGGTAKNRKNPCRENMEPLDPRNDIWPRKCESVARNELVRCYDAADTFPHGQIIGKNEMYRTSAYPHLLRKFSDGDTTVLHDQSPHLVSELVISAC
jgi:hypothetical protein